MIAIKDMIKRLFCNHKEEEIVKAIRIPYGYIINVALSVKNVGVRGGVRTIK